MTLTSHSIGNKTLNYFIGLSYKKESSFIKENLFERATTKLSLNYNPFTKLKINGSTNLAWNKNKYAKVGSAGGLGADNHYFYQYIQYTMMTEAIFGGIMGELKI